MILCPKFIECGLLALVSPTELNTQASMYADDVVVDVEQSIAIH